MFLDPQPDSAAYCYSLETPVGWLTVNADERALTGLDWGRRVTRPSPLTTDAAAQLGAYFAGTLKQFDLPLAPAGSAHELRVWAELCRIPYGETITYGELARRSASVARAVGGTCGANPIGIVIPCHRVTAAGGALGGYSGAGGPATKKKLLAFEARHSGIFTLSP
ncbi:MAG: methylated-DNA--[protein]-cysteine S-methyltransferase [Alphaproteobacteria bacterium]